MLDEFSAQSVSLEVLRHLERHRPAIVHDEGLVRAEVDKALERVRVAYEESALPARYFEALRDEVRTAVPARWQPLAARFTALERSDFGLWRGGDVVARLSYVFIGLAIGGLCVALPFIPIWEKWFPFLLAILGWWLPSAQVVLVKRRYARALGDIAGQMASAQPQLERSVPLDELLLPPDEGEEDERKKL